MTRDGSTSVKQILDQVIEELRSTRADRAIETEFALDEPVNCDPVRIAQPSFQISLAMPWRMEHLISRSALGRARGTGSLSFRCPMEGNRFRPPLWSACSNHSFVDRRGPINKASGWDCILLRKLRALMAA